MYKGIKDNVAIVTGGASGVGEKVVRSLVTEGANVVIADQNLEKAQLLAAELGQKTIALHVDVTQAEQVEKLVKKTIEKFGYLGLAVNSAGISGKRETAVDTLDLDAWRSVIDINLNGTFYCLKYQTQAMLEKGGSIVNLGSILSLVGVAGSAGYVSSKHALVGLTKAAALDYAQKGIRINLVGPGYTETPLISTGMSSEFRKSLEGKHPMGRLGKPEEIAELCLFLLSDQASFITGSTHMVDGGYSIQ